MAGKIEQAEWRADCLKSRMDSAERERVIADADWTSYEVAIMKGGRTIKRLGFSERKTKSVLLDYVQKNRQAILSECDDSDLDREWKYDGNAIVFGKVKVGFTGETKKSTRSDDNASVTAKADKGGETAPNCVEADSVATDGKSALRQINELMSLLDEREDQSSRNNGYRQHRTDIQRWVKAVKAAGLEVPNKLQNFKNFWQ